MSVAATASPVRYVLRRHVGLVLGSLAIMAAAPYLGSLPVRTIPTVVALASEAPVPPGGELRVFLGDRAGDLAWVLGALIVAGAASFLLALINTRVAARLGSLASRDLRLRLHALLLARPPGWLAEDGRHPKVVNALVAQSRVAASYATNTLPAAIGVVFAVVIWSQTLFVAVDAPGQRGTAVVVVAGVVALLLAINLSAVWLAGARSQASQKEVVARQGAFMAIASESAKHQSSLQLDTARDAQQRRLEEVLDAMVAAEVRVASWSGLASAASGGVIMLGIPLLVVAWKGLGLDGARLAVMIPALLMLQRSIASVGSLWTSRKVALPAIELVTELFAAEPTIDRDGAPLDVPVEGRLRFDDVRWSAGGAEILRGVTLDVAPGETVAIVGAGGSGKSSLLRLAACLAEPSDGTIELDGTDVTALDVDALRRRVAVLEQHPALLARSIRDNLALDDRPLDDARIAQVAELTRFDEVLAEHGLDRALGADGAPLSGSQKRRLALTRALLREPDVLLVDELEAGLPQAHARAILADVRRATRGTTCVMVTHRPDLLDADRCAFIAGGIIVDVGTHAELEARCEPYRSLLATRRDEEEHT